MSRYYDVVIKNCWDLTSFVRALTFQRADGAPFRVRPGQFFMLHLERDGERLVRSYSVANPVPNGGECETIEICVAIIEDGYGSGFVGRAVPGDIWTLSGPHGRFILRDTPQHLALVATGTGIAPYRSMVPQLKELLDAGHTVSLIMGARDIDGFLYDEEFTNLERSHDEFRYFRCASRPNDPTQFARENDRLGRVQTVVDATDTADTMFYLCGNPQMVSGLKASLAERGVERKHVRTEAYVSP